MWLGSLGSPPCSCVLVRRVLHCVCSVGVRLVVSGVCCVDSSVCFAHNLQLVAVPRFETEVVVREDRKLELEDKEEGGKRSRVQRVQLQFSAEELDRELPTFMENTRKKLRAAVGGDVTFDRLYVKSGAVLGSPGLVACRDHAAVLFADERIADEGGWARKLPFIVETLICVFQVLGLTPITSVWKGFAAAPLSRTACLLGIFFVDRFS